MSIRTNLQRIKKIDYVNITKMNIVELIEYVNVKDKEKFTEEEVYLTIKYVGDNLLQICDLNNELIEKIKKDFLINEETKDLAKNYGHELFTIDKKGLEEIIEYYRSQVLENFNRDLKKMENIQNKIEKGLPITSSEQYDLINLINKLKRKISDFGGERKHKFYRLGNKLQLLDSESLEFEIFNLISLYNNFDWENEIMLIESS